MKIEDVVLLKNNCNTDERGSLTVIEGGYDIPFDIKRAFYIHDVVDDRGGHTHLETDQFAIAVHGKLKILVSDGKESRVVILDSAEYGVYLPRMTWTKLMDFSADAVCLVLSSTHYDMDKSIRTWEGYLAHRNIPEQSEFETGLELAADYKKAADKLVFMLQDELLLSALCTKGINSVDYAHNWIQKRRKSYKYTIKKVPLDELTDWSIDAKTGTISHCSGKFFKVEGLEISTNFGAVGHWLQPIINQPEIGILGFIAKNIDGILHLLVQAKMEPGNIDLVQISPTVQATRSNYTQVHGGKRPGFVEYFLGEKDVEILYDQLQSEQGSNYLKKRNRNVIVKVADDFEIDYSDDFIWLTIGQLQKLMRYSNLVHFDCRSILGGLSYAPNISLKNFHSLNTKHSFGRRVLESIASEDTGAEMSLTEILSILNYYKCRYDLDSTSVDLNSLPDWGCRDGVIRHKNDSFFSILGISVEAENREVASWNQPIIKSVDGGIIALICQVRNGILHFIVQIRMEAGFIDTAEMAPTVQCTPENYRKGVDKDLPPFTELVMNAPSDTIRFDTMLSEEGGRFYQSQQRHVIIEMDSDFALELPDEYVWMTLNQIQNCARFNNLVNIELRSILACITPADNKEE